VSDALSNQKKTWVLIDVSPAEERVAAWEMIAEGRYMPRRTRGSFPGRELG
jgi:tetrahydromethanopterin S-methyltransferase subunit B